MKPTSTRLSGRWLLNWSEGAGGWRSRWHWCHFNSINLGRNLCFCLSRPQVTTGYWLLFQGAEGSREVDNPKANYIWFRMHKLGVGVDDQSHSSAYKTRLILCSPSGTHFYTTDLGLHVSLVGRIANNPPQWPRAWKLPRAVDRVFNPL